MICHIQPTLAHMLSVGVRHDGVGAHPYACTRRRVASATDQPAASAGPRARKGRDRRSGGRGGSAGTRGPATGLVTVEHRHDFGESIEAWREAVSPVYQTSDASSASGPTSPRQGGGRGGEGERDGDAPPPRRRRLSRAEYEVEDILGVRSHDGEVQYLIKWKGCAAAGAASRVPGPTPLPLLPPPGGRRTTTPGSRAATSTICTRRSRRLNAPSATRARSMDEDTANYHNRLCFRTPH